MKHRALLSLAIIATVLSVCNLSAQTYDYDSLIKRIKADHAIGNGGNKTKTDDWIADMNADGSWSDLPYGPDITNDDNTHLDRLYNIARYSTDTANDKYGDSTYLDAVKYGLHYWAGSNTGNMENAQWFSIRIGWPKRIGEILELMRQFPGYTNQGILAISEDSVLATLPDTAVSKMDYWGAGANMLDVGMHYIYRGILEEDSTKLIRIRNYK